MLKTISVTTAAALFAISGLAVAAGTSKSTSASGSTAQPSFAAVDKNHDGKVSRSEWDAYFKKSGSSSAGGTSKSSGMSQNKAASGSSSTAPKKY